MITVGEPSSGRYEIWVGSDAERAPSPATLLLSSTTLDENLTVRSGEFTAGFVAGPERAGYVNVIEAGGLVPARSVQQGCSGYVNAAPGYVYPYTPGVFSIAVQVVSDLDTTLVVRDPDGYWYCDDDSFGDGNPMIVVETPLAGRYSIWVGTREPVDPPELLAAEDDPIGIEGLAEWFAGDGTDITATVNFFEFTPGCALVPGMPGAQRC